MELAVGLFAVILIGCVLIAAGIGGVLKAAKQREDDLKEMKELSKEVAQGPTLEQRFNMSQAEFDELEMKVNAVEALRAKDREWYETQVSEMNRIIKEVVETVDSLKKEPRQLHPPPALRLDPVRFEPLSLRVNLVHYQGKTKAKKTDPPKVPNNVEPLPKRPDGK